MPESRPTIEGTVDSTLDCTLDSTLDSTLGAPPEIAAAERSRLAYFIAEVRRRG